MPGFDLNIRVTNLNETAAGLRRFSGGVSVVLNRHIKRVLDRVVVIMRRYPPRRGNYVRTGLLGRSWKVRSANSLASWRLENEASRKGIPYTSYVVGDSEGGGQAWMHAGRWKIARDVVEAETEAQQPRLDRDLQGYAIQVGL